MKYHRIDTVPLYSQTMSTCQSWQKTPTKLNTQQFPNDYDVSGDTPTLNM